MWLDEPDFDPDSEAGLTTMMQTLETEDAPTTFSPPMLTAAPAVSADSAQKALRLGDILVLPGKAIPSEEQTNGARLIIRLPCVVGAWGSGSHATTRLMLRLLQTPPLLERLRAGSCNVCDFGHGSGVLALAAVALGEGCGTRATGVDIEPSSVAGARENASASGGELASRCQFVLPPASFLTKDLDFSARFGDWRSYPAADILPEPAHQFDIVVANILPGPLTALAPTLAALLKPGGVLAITGCQSFQVAHLMTVYASAGVPLRPLLRDDTGGKWVLLVGGEGAAGLADDDAEFGFRRHAAGAAAVAAGGPAAPLEEEAPTPEMTLEALPDDALRAIFYVVCGDGVSSLADALRLFAASRRLRAAARSVVDQLTLGSSACTAEGGGGLLQLPYTRAGPFDLYYRGEASLLAPFSWAQSLAGLRMLRIGRLSWGGAARLLTLLPAWRQLEQLELRFDYTPGLPEFHLRSMHNNHTPFQDFAADLAASLRTGCLPHLRFLFLGNLARTHCLGQRLSTRAVENDDDYNYYGHPGSAGPAGAGASLRGRGGAHSSTSVELDDRAVLETLRPTVCGTLKRSRTCP